MSLWHLLAKANADNMLEWLKYSVFALANVLTLQSRYKLHLILRQKQFLAAILARRVPKMSGNWISHCLQAAELVGARPWGAVLEMTKGDIYSTVINLINHWVSVLSHINILKRVFLWSWTTWLLKRHCWGRKADLLHRCECDGQRVNHLQLLDTSKINLPTEALLHKALCPCNWRRGEWQHRDGAQGRIFASNLATQGNALLMLLSNCGPWKAGHAAG